MTELPPVRFEGMRILRRHFCCLPFQISHFNRLDELADRVSGKWASVPGKAPCMDWAGNIWVDDVQFAALAEAAVPALTDPEYLDHVEAMHGRHLDTLQQALDRAAAPGDVKAQAADLGEAIAAIAPYGLFTKIVPPRLRDAAQSRIALLAPALDAASRERLLEPAAAPGAQLACALLEAAIALTQAGAVLALAEHPENLPTEARAVLLACCNELAGYGPHAWEAPGYECPVTLLANIRSRFSGLDIVALQGLLQRQRERQTLRRQQQSELDARWLAQDEVLARQVRALRYWTVYVDEQATRMRRAFHLGWLSLLRRLAESAPAHMAASDMLFLTREEIVAGWTPDRAQTVQERRGEYHRNTSAADYPTLAADRLDALMSGASSITAMPVQALSVADAAPVRPPSTSGCLPGLSASARSAAQGQARVLGPGGDMLAVPAGAILITPLVTPDMAPLFWNIAGVVVEEGGLLQHATALAREFGLPCVVGCVGASELIQNGDLVRVDGAAGLVRFERSGECLHAASA